MARPLSNTVDYFPHMVHHGKTMAIMQERFGNDGYAFWFRLLELLGKTDGHFYSCKLPVEIQFLSVETHVEPDKCLIMLDMLVLLDAIDAHLWSTQRIIWSENFIKGVADAYKNRRRPMPEKPFLQVETPVSTSKTPVSTPDNPHMKGNERRLDERKLDFPAVENIPYMEIKNLWNKYATAEKKIQAISSKRQNQIKSRWIEWKSLKTIEETFRNFFDAEFTRDWKNGDFDWIIKNDSNWVKVYEGKYLRGQAMEEGDYQGPPDGNGGHRL